MGLTRRIVSILTLAAITAACTGSNKASPSPQVHRGGVLKIQGIADPGLDPQKGYFHFEFSDCCLGRTLLNYNGLPPSQGGFVLRPDLATGMPDVSSDGLTWTLHIKPGIHYAPPFQNVAISSGDFIIALDREATPQGSAGGYPFYYSVIQGFDDVMSGKAKTISGLQAPTPDTLVVQLAKPAGDFGYRMAMPATAPIPSGASDGHIRDYGRFLVSSGPYMVQGGDKVDYSSPPSQQQPASGYIPGQSLVMVRNPSWDRATDPLREANPAEIQTTFGGNVEDGYNRIEAGDLDLYLDANAPAQMTKKDLSDPELKPFLHITPTNTLDYIAINLAEPPFDDVHVRKAMSLAIDKSGLQKLSGGPSAGVIATHLFEDNLVAGQLTNYDPYATPGNAGDIAAAKAEMKLAPEYDTNGDGVCDVAACNGVLAITQTGSVYQQRAALIRQNLNAIGITMDVKELNVTTMFSKCADPRSYVALCLGALWGIDFPDAGTDAVPLFESSGIGPNACCNDSLAGASSSDLKKWGYSVTSVPSADQQIKACGPLTGNDRATCWANVDKYLMETVVPAVPYLVENSVYITSKRVTNFTYGRFGLPSLAHIAVNSS